MFSNDCLRGGTYLVTGASSGIGRATALLISQCGGRVIITGRDEGRLEDTYYALDSGASHVSSVQSLSDADETAEWVKGLVESHGILNGVFHAAGVELIRPARLIKQAQLDVIFGGSLYAAFGISRAICQKNVLNDGGSVVFMSSVAGSAGQTGLTAYSSAKAGIDGLTRSLACEVASRGIRVNSIAAGAVKTAMHERLFNGSGDAAAASYENSHLLGFGDPIDIANCVIFLLSSGSKWITGSTLAVDGGYMTR
ncbi:SDR family NAD(P)-dependent oxidoreductase [Cupriavidus basilensis]|uniref:SDR family NAD(P)-dependent oxidoreductase n=1 Tax=Cupriavidus basilensis TaxID=68895 RepID=UPI0023E85513|nr:SDR family oxidoreductase [Cupriavidus basilensis]MDF3886625.1 SDR family NAD(P)-dependent oxidoreductase [Cupriavidus basilensis]